MHSKLVEMELENVRVEVLAARDLARTANEFKQTWLDMSNEEKATESGKNYFFAGKRYRNLSLERSQKADELANNLLAGLENRPVQRQWVWERLQEMLQ